MLKILHTSDLHIGKRLYQADLYPEQAKFFEWLVDYISHNNIDALLVSGDVFDVANPSSESRRLYYQLLRQLMVVNCKVIIAGGNHDSPQVLEAPRELLRHLDIHVVGRVADDPDKLLIPVGSKEGSENLVVACVPYLRDADLRMYQPDETYEDRLEMIRMGISGVFQRLADQCRQQYPDAPAIAMGHLYVQGSNTSESERDIQIGNLAGLEVKNLPTSFGYYALGHLHKPQEPAKGIVYSGSPVQLSFSEADNNNRVMMITARNGKLDYQSIEVPRFRNLVRLEGTVDQLHDKLKKYPNSGNSLVDYIELLALEEEHNPARVMELESIIDSFGNEVEGASIIKYRIHFNKKAMGMTDIYEETRDIAELKPVDVFESRLEKEQPDERTKGLLMDAFREILEEVEQKTEE